MPAHDNIDKLLMLQALQTVEPVSTSTAGYLYPQPEQKGSFLRDMFGFVTDIGVDSGELDWRKLPLYMIGLGLTVGGGGASKPFRVVKMMPKAEKLLIRGRQGVMVPGHVSRSLEFPKKTFKSEKTVLEHRNTYKKRIKEEEKIVARYKSEGKGWKIDKGRSMQLWSDKKHLEALEDFLKIPESMVK